MYKVNLLGEGMSSGVFISDLDTKKPKSSLKLILSLIIGIVMIGIGAWYFQQSQSTDELKLASDKQVINKNLKAPKKTPKKVVPTAAIAVEETVSDVQVAKKPKPAARGKGYPNENIYGQRVAVESMLKRILQASGNGVGFSSLIIQAPNYYFMHGLAPTSKEYTSFQKALKKVSSQSKVSKEKNRGISGKAKEFTIYGEFALPKTPKSSNKNLNYTMAVTKSLAEMKKIAIQAGLNIQKVVQSAKQKDGKYTRNIIRVEFKSTYKTLFPFLNKLKKSKTPIGIVQLTMNATPEEEISGVFDLVVYHKN